MWYWHLLVSSDVNKQVNNIEELFGVDENMLHRVVSLR